MKERKKLFFGELGRGRGGSRDPVGARCHPLEDGRTNKHMCLGNG